MNVPRIRGVTAADNNTLLIEFTDGKRKRFDVTPLLKNEMFLPLRDKGFFKNVRISPGGYMNSGRKVKKFPDLKLFRQSGSGR